MTDLITELREFRPLAGEQAWPIMSEAAATITELVEALEWIATNYENGHLNHVDYRVQAKHLADAALARVRTQEPTI